MLKDKVTLILTLKDNEEFTYRWLDYMSDQQCDLKIFIADGGSNKLIQEVLNNKSNYSNLNYEYIRYPFDENIEVFYKKLIDVVNRVQTPYLLFMDNDDFFILDHIDVFVDYLEKNKDTVSCGGQTASLSLYSKNNRLLNKTIGEGYILSRPLDENKSIIQDNPTLRICDFFKRADSSCLWLNWYFIHNTIAVQKTLQYLSKKSFKDVVSLEIYVQMSLSIMGKSVQLDYPYYIRQEGTSTTTANLNKTGNIFFRFLKNDVITEVKESIDYIGMNLSINEKNKIFDGFILWFALHSSNIYNINKKNTLGNIIKNLNNFKVHSTMLKINNLLRNIFAKRKIQYYEMRNLGKYVLDKKN